MKIAIYTLTDSEIKDQKITIAKYEALIQKELSFGALMNPENVTSYAKAIKNAHDLILNGIAYENEFMVKNLKNEPNVKIVTA